MGIVLNLESGARPANASSETIEVHLPGTANAARFACAGSVRVEELGHRPAAPASLPDFKSKLELPEDAMVISEAEFYRILSQKQDIEISKEAKQTAARIITAAGEPSSLGIQGRFVEGATFSTSLVVVTRDPKVNGATLGAKQLYLTPINFADTRTGSARGPC